jgi:hypothetical protein
LEAVVDTPGELGAFLFVAERFDPAHMAALDAGVPLRDVQIAARTRLSG